MDAAGGQEMATSAPAAFEEAAKELRSYHQLPQVWYAIRQRFECRRFSLEETRHEIGDSIPARCGLPDVIRTDEGRDSWAVCVQCRYEDAVETANTKPSEPGVEDPAGAGGPEPFHTPGRKTIAQVAEFVGLPETSQMKSLVLVANGAPVLALVRGDHQLSETKFALALGDVNFRPARPDEIFEWFGAGAGSLGPVGVKNMRLVMDEALAGRRNMIAGANRDDYHLKNVTPGRDFQAEKFDLRQAAAGDGCRSCGGRIEILKAMPLSRTVRAREMRELHVTNDAGQEVPILMDSCSVWPDRMLLAVALTSRDDDGLIVPRAIAPFEVIVTPANWRDEAQRNLALEVYAACRGLELDTLLDDRDERAGVKFKDADLIGIPFRVVVGKKAGERIVEIVDRKTKEKREAAADEAPAAVRSALTGEA